jgi:hypothetical protein
MAPEGALFDFVYKFSGVSIFHERFFTFFAD